jgi:adenylosuccinate lyase
MASEMILMHASAAGGDRQELHERIRQHAMAAAGRMKIEGGRADLLERIADDDAFDMNLEQLVEIVDPARFVGRAPEQVDRFLAEWVQPALARLKSGADEHLGEPDVRV